MRYFKNTSWMFAEQLLRMVAGLMVGIWVARYLGPTNFGIFSYATAFVAIFAGTAKLGLDSILVRDLVSTPEKRDVYLGTSFWLKIIGSVLTIVIIFIGTRLSNISYPINLYILIIASGIVFQSFEVIDFYFQSKVESKFVSICKITQSIISSILKIYLITIDADLFWFFVVSLADQLVLAFALYIAYSHQKLNKFYKYFDKRLAYKLLKESWPLLLSSIVYVIYARIDQILIKEMLGVREVGIYTAALRLSEVWLFIPLLITNSIFPAIVRAKNVSETLYNSRLENLYALLLWTSIAIVTPLILLSNQIIPYLYGEAFKDSVIILQIHLITLVFIFLWTGAAQPIIAENRFLFAFFRNLFGLFVNVSGNVYLIPKFGIVGAALSSLFGYIASSVIANLLYKPMRNTFFMQLKALVFPLLFIRKFNA